MNHFTRRISHVSTAVAVAILFVVTMNSSATAQVLLKGGDVHTANGDVIDGGSVLLGADGNIAAVGAEVELSEGTKVIDVTGKVITPGFIEGQSKLGVVEIWAVAGTFDPESKKGDDRVHAAFRTADAFNPNSVAIPVARTGGVTSAIVTPVGGIVSGQSSFVEVAGEDSFGRMIDESVAFHTVFGEAASRITDSSRGDTVLALRELYDDVNFFQENQELFDENRSRALAASRLDLLALQDTLGGQKPMVFHANRASDIIEMLEFAKAEGIRPIISGGAEAWMVADRLASEKTPVITNPLYNLPFRFESLGARADNVALLHEAGVPVIIATSDTHNVRNLRQLAGNAIRAGLPRDAAIAAVTKNVAEAFGQGDRYGTIEPGKRANVVVWSGDPFEIETRVEHLFIGGEEVSLDNRQERLLQRYRELERRGEPAPTREDGEQTEDEDGEDADN